MIVGERCACRDLECPSHLDGPCQEEATATVQVGHVVFGACPACLEFHAPAEAE